MHGTKPSYKTMWKWVKSSNWWSTLVL
jgi:hypothetical protein